MTAAWGDIFQAVADELGTHDFDQTHDTEAIQNLAREVTEAVHAKLTIRSEQEQAIQDAADEQLRAASPDPAAYRSGRVETDISENALAARENAANRTPSVTPSQLPDQFSGTAPEFGTVTLRRLRGSVVVGRYMDPDTEIRRGDEVAIEVTADVFEVVR